MAAGADYFAREYRKKQETVLITDRECAECGYNLRGLKVGGRCPECGSAIERPLAKDDPLARMPWRVIRVFLAGAWIAVAAILIALTAVWLVHFEVISWQYVSLGVPALAALWVAGMWMLTPAFTFPEAVVRGFARRSKLRRAARLGQLAWIVAAAAFVIRENVNIGAAANEALSAVMIAGVIAGWIATILLALLFERLAEWVRDDTAQRVFNWFEWLTPIAAAILWFVGSVGIISLVMTGLTMAAVALFPLGVVMLAKSITFSWQHRVEHEMREDRRAARTRRDAERAAARLEQVDPGLRK